MSMVAAYVSATARNWDNSRSSARAHRKTERSKSHRCPCRKLTLGCIGGVVRPGLARAGDGFAATGPQNLIWHAARQPDEQQTIGVIEGRSLWRLAPEHVDLLAKNQDLRFTPRTGQEQSNERTTKQSEQLDHRATASPDSHRFALYGVSDTDKHYASIIHATIPISTTTTATIRATIARRRRRSSNSRNSPSKCIRPAANEFARLGSASSNKPPSKGEKMMA